MNNLNKTKPNPRLTQRQMQCAESLLNGRTAKETAFLLGLSTRTVEYYLGNIKLKLECRNKSELIAKLIQLSKADITT
jgi:DNA-binding CsgD family transcriptional regulator